MTFIESQQVAERNRHIDENKFDRHMTKARQSDINSRQKIFVSQVENSEAAKVERNEIKPSIY